MSGAETIWPGASLARGAAADPLAATWSDEYGTALVRPDLTLAPVGIDTYALWSDLQTAYPDGGGALLALPADTMVYVAERRALFARNAAGTLWVREGEPQPIVDAVAVAPHTGTLAKTIQKSIFIPAGTATANTMFRLRVRQTRAVGSGAALASSQGAIEVLLNSANNLTGAQTLYWTRCQGANNLTDYDVVFMTRGSLSSQIGNNNIETPGAVQGSGAFRALTIDLANDAWILITFQLSDVGHIHTLESAALEIIRGA